MNISIRIAESDADLEAISPVLMELRPHLAHEELIAQIKRQQGSGYQVACAEADSKIVGAAGFVLEYKLAWGKHMYIDDLVTTERCRSSGVGSRLIEWLKGYAQEQGCNQIHLDSGVQRFAAHRFYLHHGFDISSHHFSIADIGGAHSGSA